MTTLAGPARPPIATAGGRGPLAPLAQLLRPWRRWLVAIALCVITGAAMELVPPLLVRQIVDQHLTPRRAEGLLLLAVLYLAATAAIQVAGALVNYLSAVVAQGVLRELRVRLFAHLQQLPASYHDRTPLGDTISRCTADVETLDRLFSTGVVSVVTDLVRLVTVAVAMIALSPRLSLFSAVVIPPLVLLTRFFQVRIRDAERANRKAVGQLNVHLQETLAGVEVIRAFGRERTFANRFREALRQTLIAFQHSTICSSTYSPAMAVLAAATTAGLLILGTHQGASHWSVSTGALIAFVLLFQRFFKPLTAIGDEWQTVQGALSGAERIFQVLAIAAEEPPALRVPTEPAASIELEDVTFGYVPGHPVLHGICLSVHPGERIALVGRSGAGKSSVFHLLGGLYPPWSGQIRLAGVAPSQVSDEQRRRLIGVVPQSVQLFSGTIAENLTLGDPEVPLAAIRRAAALTGLAPVIAALPKQYDTLLRGSGRGEGIQLSAGQRQLLALTRALVWDPPILLLDEATSALDSASDAAFRAALNADHGAMRGMRGMRRTVVTIAHRLATARESDRVIVLDQGRIVEMGCPDDLIRAGGIFASLLELEAAGWNWHNGDPS